MSFKGDDSYLLKVASTSVAFTYGKLVSTKWYAQRYHVRSNLNFVAICVVSSASRLIFTFDLVRFYSHVLPYIALFINL